MGVKRQRAPFRGHTPENVFQTVDIGAGKGEWIKRQSERYSPCRKYAAIDPAWAKEHSPEVKRLKEAGVTVHEQGYKEFFEEMKGNNQKTRHINVDYSEPNLERTIDFADLFERAPQVLLPTGKIFVSSEFLWIIQRAEQEAKKRGYSTKRVRKLEPLPSDSKIIKFMAKTLRRAKILAPEPERTLKEYKGKKGGASWMASKGIREQKGGYHKIMRNKPVYRLEIAHTHKAQQKTGKKTN